MNMIRLVFKNLWAKKKRNGWLLAELVAVSIILWHFVDPLVVQTYVNLLPDGYDKENLFLIKLSTYPSSSSFYTRDADELENRRSVKWRLLEQVRHYPGVESASFQMGDFAPGGASWSSSAFNFFKDSVMLTTFCLEYVPQSDYFKTYRFQSAGGPSIAEIDSMGFQKQRIMTEGAFEDGPTLGRSILEGKEVRVIATVQPIKVRPERAPQQVVFGQRHPEDANIVFRLREGIDAEDFLSEFRPWVQKTLCAGNFFVQSVSSYEDYVKRSTIQMDYDYRINMLLMSFFLFCLFFGVTGAFWMQTRSRREEVGIMKSFGATSAGIVGLFVSEGLVLATVAVTAGSVIYLQYALHEGFFLPDNGNCSQFVHYWYENFKLHFAVIMSMVWLLTALVVSVGICIPAWGISRKSPTDSLHDE